MRWVIIICIATFGFTSDAYAAKSSAKFNVDVNGSALLQWDILCEQPGEVISMYGSSSAFGSTGNSITYTGQTMRGSEEDIDLTCNNEGEIKIFSYTVASTIQEPGYIFEFPIVYVPRFGYTQYQEITVAYPPGLKLIAASHPYTITSDGKVKFEFKFTGYNSLGDAIMLTFVDKIPKIGSGHIRIGPFDVYGEERHIRKLNSIAWAAPSIPQMFSETIGTKLDSSVNILVVDLLKIHTDYESSGVTISPNVILLDSDDLIQFSELGLLQILVHELSHAVTWDTAFDPSIPWLTEGVAVFHEYYFIDAYIPRIKNMTPTFIQIISDYPKFSFKDLALQYKRPFDYEFLEDTENHPITDSYSHAGLVFYKLFLDDKNILKKFVDESSPYTPDPNCNTCNSKRALAILQRISGQSKDDILFPFKGLADMPPQYAVLFSKPVSSEEETRAWASYYKSNSKGYFTDDSPVENYETASKIPERTPAETTNYAQPEIQSNTAIDLPSQTNEEVPPQMKESLISRFFDWLLDLF